MAREDEIPKNARESLARVRKKAKHAMETQVKPCGKRDTHEPHTYKKWGVTRKCNGHRQ